MNEVSILKLVTLAIVMLYVLVIMSIPIREYIQAVRNGKCAIIKVSGALVALLLILITSCFIDTSFIVHIFIAICTIVGSTILVIKRDKN